MDSIPSTDNDMEAYTLTVNLFLVEALQNPRHRLTTGEKLWTIEIYAWVEGLKMDMAGSEEKLQGTK